MGVGVARVILNTRKIVLRDRPYTHRYAKSRGGGERERESERIYIACYSHSAAQLMRSALGFVGPSSQTSRRKRSCTSGQAQASRDAGRRSAALTGAVRGHAMAAAAGSQCALGVHTVRDNMIDTMLPCMSIFVSLHGRDATQRVYLQRRGRCRSYGSAISSAREEVRTDPCQPCHLSIEPSG